MGIVILKNFFQKILKTVTVFNQWRVFTWVDIVHDSQIPTYPPT